ncbi:hypothetical protein GGF50DRAFT_111833 [Schizophyllum commune]
MHVALQTTELVREIIQYLDRPSLISVAATCQELSPPALSILWRTCRTLRPFVKLLPKDKYAFDERGRNALLFGELSANDVARVRYYADFVRWLSVWRLSTCITAEGLKKIWDALGRQFLFPNLQTFQYEGPSSLAPYLPFLIGPSVDCLDITYNFNFLGRWLSDSEEFRTEMHIWLDLRNRATNPLRTFKIFMNESLPDRAHTLVTGWDTLEDMELHVDAELRTFAAVAVLPRLKKLTVCMHDKIDISSHGPFPVNQSLEELLLDGGWLSCPEDYLAVLHPTSRIDLKVSSLESAGALRTVCRSMQKYCGIDSLRRISLVSLSPDDDEMRAGIPDVDDPLILRDIQPLLTFINLVDVHIYMHTGFDLSDDDITRMAQSWSGLRKLRLATTEFDSEAMPSCTLTGILAFAQHCPSLEVLTMVVDATAVTVPKAADIMFRHAHTSLHTFEVLHSPIAAPEQVASFLTRFFPSLGPEGLLTPAYVRDNLREDLWAWVRQLIPVLLDARVMGIYGERDDERLELIRRDVH